MFRTISMALAMTAAAGAALARPVVPEDIDRLMAVSDPQVDAAGQWVAYAVGGTDVAAWRKFTSPVAGPKHGLAVLLLGLLVLVLVLAMRGRSLRWDRRQ